MAPHKNDDDGSIPLPKRVETLEDIIFDQKNGTLGLRTRVMILWRSHVWVLCTLSAVAGSGLTFGLQYLFKH
jgi:hypothetical protein